MSFFSLNYMTVIICALLLLIIIESENIMENIETTNKATEALAKELEGLSNEGLHDFFLFFYKLNHQHYNTISPDSFEEFLEAFDSNPFKLNEDKAFRKQLIDSILKHSYDHMSLLTAAILVKKKFTISEIIENYYSNFNVYDNSLF